MTLWKVPSTSTYLTHLPSSNSLSPASSAQISKIPSKRSYLYSDRSSTPFHFSFRMYLFSSSFSQIAHSDLWSTKLVTVMKIAGKREKLRKRSIQVVDSAAVRASAAWHKVFLPGRSPTQVSIEKNHDDNINTRNEGNREQQEFLSRFCNNFSGNEERDVECLNQSTNDWEPILDNHIYLCLEGR